MLLLRLYFSTQFSYGNWHVVDKPSFRWYFSQLKLLQCAGGLRARQPAGQRGCTALPSVLALGGARCSSLHNTVCGGSLQKAFCWWFEEWRQETERSGSSQQDPSRIPQLDRPWDDASPGRQWMLLKAIPLSAPIKSNQAQLSALTRHFSTSTKQMC